jgi:HAD superfamily hydrolase (TIGR01549 family)
MYKIRAVLFDLGNTLFKLGRQEDWDWTGIHKEGLEKAGFDIEVDRLRQIILNIPEEKLAEKKVLYGDIYHFHKEIIKYILESLGYKDLTDHKLNLATMSARKEIINVQSLSDDALPCLEMLTQKGLRVGVITNAEGQTVINSERMGLARYIDFIIDSAHVGVRKPDKMIFKIAINTLQRNCENSLQPGEIMYVGNELEEDALAAKNAGLMGVWLNREDKRVDSRVPTIHSLHDLDKLIL